MSNQLTTFATVFICAAAVTVYTGCDPNAIESVSADANSDEQFEQVEKARPMKSYSAATRNGDVAYFLGTWELPPWESCALIRVFRNPDYPMDVWIDWLDKDMVARATRPVDLKDRFSDSFELDFTDTGDTSGIFSLVANVTVDPDSPFPEGQAVWATAQPCY